MGRGPNSVACEPCDQTGLRPGTSLARYALVLLPGSTRPPAFPEAFFFHSCWATTSVFGCRVSGATFRQPFRATKRYKTDGATPCPTCSAKAVRNEESTTNSPVLARSSQEVRNPFSSACVSRARLRPPHDRLFSVFIDPC